MSDSHFIACFAENSFEAKYRYPTLLQKRVHVTQPMRNSAPSRLQHIDDIVGSYSSLCGGKARSLQDLFAFEHNDRCCGLPSRESCLCSSLNHTLPTLLGEMPLPNGQIDDDEGTEVKQDLVGNDDSDENNSPVFKGVNDDAFEMCELVTSLEVNVEGQGQTGSVDGHTEEGTTHT